MSSLPKPQDSMLRDVVVDDDDDCGVIISCCCCCCGEACRLKRDVCDGANAMVCVEKSAIAAEAWATRVLLIVAARLVVYYLSVMFGRRRMVARKAMISRC